MLNEKEMLLANKYSKIWIDRVRRSLQKRYMERNLDHINIFFCLDKTQSFEQKVNYVNTFKCVDPSLHAIDLNLNTAEALLENQKVSSVIQNCQSEISSLLSQRKPRSVTVLFQIRTPMFENIGKDHPDARERMKIDISGAMNFGGMSTDDVCDCIINVLDAITKSLNVPEEIEIEIMTCKLDDPSIIVCPASGNVRSKIRTVFIDTNPSIGDVMVHIITNRIRHLHRAQFKSICDKVQTIKLRFTGGSKLYTVNPLSVSTEERKAPHNFKSVTDWVLCSVDNVLPLGILSDDMMKHNGLEPYKYTREESAISGQLINDINAGILKIQIKPKAKVSQLEDIRADTSKLVVRRVGNIGKRYEIHPTMPLTAKAITYSRDDVTDWTYLNNHTKKGAKCENVKY